MKRNAELGEVSPHDTHAEWATNQKSPVWRNRNPTRSVVTCDLYHVSHCSHSSRDVLRIWHCTRLHAAASRNVIVGSSQPAGFFVRRETRNVSVRVPP